MVNALLAKIEWPDFKCSRVAAFEVFLEDHGGRPESKSMRRASNSCIVKDVEVRFVAARRHVHG